MRCRGEIGAFATPDVVHWAPALPKTRSGKIQRHTLHTTHTVHFPSVHY